MASYNAVPESEQLLNKTPKTKSWKRLAGSAAVASFVLGCLAVTAVKSPVGLRGATSLKHHNKATGTTAASCMKQTLVSNEPISTALTSFPRLRPRPDRCPALQRGAKRPARAREAVASEPRMPTSRDRDDDILRADAEKDEQKRTYDVLQLGASGASTLKRGTRGSLPQTAHGPAAEASSSAASSSSVVGGGGGDGS